MLGPCEIHNQYFLHKCCRKNLSSTVVVKFECVMLVLVAMLFVTLVTIFSNGPVVVWSYRSKGQDCEKAIFRYHIRMYLLLSTSFFPSTSTFDWRKRHEDQLLNRRQFLAMFAIEAFDLSYNLTIR